MVSAVATFTSLGKRASSFYQDRGFEPEKVLFVERKGGKSYIGFDYMQAAKDIATRTNQEQVSQVVLLTEETALQDDTFTKELSLRLYDKILLKRITTNTFSRKSKCSESTKTPMTPWSSVPTSASPGNADASSTAFSLTPATRCSPSHPCPPSPTRTSRNTN